jgi:hypothetical protein
MPSICRFNEIIVVLTHSSAHYDHVRLKDSHPIHASRRNQDLTSTKGLSKSIMSKSCCFLIKPWGRTPSPHTISPKSLRRGDIAPDLPLRPIQNQSTVLVTYHPVFMMRRLDRRTSPESRYKIRIMKNFNRFFHVVQELSRNNNNNNNNNHHHLAPGRRRCCCSGLC